jgi:acyl CoA:acetate/3-ketoacid CoA transferase
MRYIVALHQGRDGIVRRVGLRTFVDCRPKDVEVLQVLQHHVGADAEINETSDLVYIVSTQFSNGLHAACESAEQAAGLEITVEGVLQQRVHLFFG